MEPSATFRLAVADGAELHVRSWLPAGGGRIRGVVQVAHGMAEHGGRYGGAAARLVAAGFAVHAPDQRGHGRSVTSPAELGLFRSTLGFDALVLDLEAVARELGRRHPGVPLVLLGHSMGSLAAELAMGRFPHAWSAVVLSGPLAQRSRLELAAGGALARAVRRLRGPGHRSVLLNALAVGRYQDRIPEPRTPFDWLSRDAQAVDACLADPLCGWLAPAQFWIDLTGGLRERESARRGTDPRTPVLLLWGSEDPAGRYGVGPEALRRALGAREHEVTSRGYEGARHEVLQETNRDEVLADLVGWLGARLEPASA